MSRVSFKPQQVTIDTRHAGYATIKELLDEHSEALFRVIRLILEPKNKMFIPATMIYTCLEQEGIYLGRADKIAMSKYLNMVFDSPYFESYSIGKRPRACQGGMQFVCYDSDYDKGPKFAEHLITLLQELHLRGCKV